MAAEGTDCGLQTGTLSEWVSMPDGELDPLSSTEVAGAQLLAFSEVIEE
jgi:hypothetical protein